MYILHLVILRLIMNFYVLFVSVNFSFPAIFDTQILIP